MINQLLMKLGLGDGSLNAEGDTRRKFIRYPGAQADVSVGGSTYSLRDWSLGGISFETLPDARLLVGDSINFTLRFRFPQGVVAVEQQGRVVRTGKRGIAAAFVMPDADARKALERVLDGYHAQNFLQSQVA